MKNIFALLMVLSICSCATEKSPELKVLQGDAFGTTYTIQYFTATEFKAEKGIDSVLYAVNKSMSTYLPQSDISKINRGDTTVVVDDMFKEVWRISETVHTNSKGYFDPTVGTLRNAYGFGDTKPVAEIDIATLDSLRELVGFRKFQINENGTITKSNPNVYIDFNAVAKGYGIDQLGNFLESNNITDYIIELGGEILAKGRNVKKDSFWISGVEALDSDVDNRKATVLFKLENRGLAGSGNYRKYRIDDITGKKYVHTINPLTGLAEQSDVTSATLIAPSCALADAYATACMAMGFERAKKMLSGLDGVEAYLTYTDTENATQVYSTEGFKKLVLN